MSNERLYYLLVSQFRKNKTDVKDKLSTRGTKIGI